jgi:menaquinone-specific isochorismate synthase
VRTIPITDPGGLVGALPEPAALAWIRHGEGLVGWGEAARITLPAGEDRFTAGEKWLRELFEGAQVDDQVGAPGCGPVAFGSFTFDSTSDGSVLVVPSTIIGRRGGQSWMTTIGETLPPVDHGQAGPSQRGSAGAPSPNGQPGWAAVLGPHGQRGQQGLLRPDGQPGQAGIPRADGQPGPRGALLADEVRYLDRPLSRNGSRPPGRPLGDRAPSSAAVTPGLASSPAHQAWSSQDGIVSSNGAARLHRPLPGTSEVRWHDGSLAAPDWELAVAAAVGRIQAGHLRKVVLARDLYATASTDIDARLLLHQLAGRYPECYTFACAGLVGATPELLIRRQDTDISSLVLAGTVPRGRDAAEDATLGASLLSSAKDIEEHEYAVASVRTALARLCDELVVDSRPSLLRLANVQHLATGISGRLAQGTDGHEHSVLALAAALHPPGAVCGTPTEAAMELIRELEGMDRGRYAGPVGWIDARGNGEWGIALRCAEIDGPRARLFAGGGIVAGSDPAAELAETQAKFSVMQFALES